MLFRSKFAEIYSPYLPPQVNIQNDGTIKAMKMDIHYKKRKEGDIIILSGDFQGITPESQYQLSEESIRFCKKFGLKRVYTLGGLGTGNIVKTPKVFGAATNKKLVKEHEKYGVEFRGGGAIFGASGLLLAFAMREEIDAVCLMGETHGQIIDAKSAEAVLNVLTKVLGLKIEMNKLEEKAKETEKQMSHLSKMISAYQKMEERQNKMSDEFPSYIR